MAELDLRVRNLGRLISPIAIADQTREQIRRSQERPMPHTLRTDLLLGAPRKDVATRNVSAAGADGPIRIRAYRPGRIGGVSGLPRALVHPAEHDPIRDDGPGNAAALEAAGVPVRTTPCSGMPHGSLAFPHLCSAVPRAMGESTAEVRAALAPRSS
ncbi:MAG TPA: alpha/beta hydrolase fold domain-containing protein [Amnibacterium sp.]